MLSRTGDLFGSYWPESRRLAGRLRESVNWLHEPLRRSDKLDLLKEHVLWLPGQPMDLVYQLWEPVSRSRSRFGSQLAGSRSLFSKLYGPQRKKICHRGFANNTRADQPAHPRSLISAFVIRIFRSNICKLA